jgi:hypothetical protein
LFGRKLNNAGVATEQHDAVQGHCCHYAERRPYGWLCHRRRWRPTCWRTPPRASKPCCGWAKKSRVFPDAGSLLATGHPRSLSSRHLPKHPCPMRQSTPAGSTTTIAHLTRTVGGQFGLDSIFRGQFRSRICRHGMIRVPDMPPRNDKEGLSMPPLAGNQPSLRTFLLKRESASRCGPSPIPSLL